ERKSKPANAAAVVPPPTNIEPRDAQKADAPKQPVVAMLDKDTPLTREEFGEYLIRRYGTNKLELFVNLRIIENACARKGIVVTESEVDEALRDDLEKLNVTKESFHSKFLKPNGKTWVEWREDVIRPRLMMTKLCSERVTVSNEDLRRAFENKFGEKKRCRM